VASHPLVLSLRREVCPRVKALRAKAEIGRGAADPAQDRSSPKRGGFRREGWVPFPWGNPRGWLRAGLGSPEALSHAAHTPTAELPGGGGSWAGGEGFLKKNLKGGVDMLISYPRQRRKKSDRVIILSTEQALNVLLNAVKTGGWIEIESEAEAEILKRLLPDLPEHLRKEVKQEIEYFEALSYHLTCCRP